MSIKKIQVISRNPDNYIRESKSDIYRINRNYDPELHPFSASREYKQALNAAKLERIFAKPFIGSLSHLDAVSTMCKHPKSLSYVLSGTFDGELYLWDLKNKNCDWKVKAHIGRIHDICTSSDGNHFFSVGNDKTVKRWSLEDMHGTDTNLPVDTYLSDSMITGISYNRFSEEFVTCGEHVFLWDTSSKSPKACFDWSTSSNSNEASVVCIKFNPVETNLFCSSDNANNIVLYDTRLKEVKKLKMTHRINSFSWNPMEAFIFTAASNDYKQIVSIHEDHTDAVIDIDYSPTGKEFCSAGYDRSVRLFKVEERHSHDVYHTRRMFKVNCVVWTADNKYILSGSMDHNIRIWKAKASEKLGYLNAREQAALNTAEELKKKYSQFPEIKKIAKHRHLPKRIYNAKKELIAIKNSKARKEYNKKMHSRPGSVKSVHPCLKPVVGLQDEVGEEDEVKDGNSNDNDDPGNLSEHSDT